MAPRPSADDEDERAPREDERALVAACAAGDEAAWGRFHARYERLVRRVAARALARLGAADPDDRAADVANDVFAALLERDRAALRRFEGRSSLATWLCVLARRQAARAERRRRPEALDGSPDARAATGPSPGDAAAADELRRRVREHLGALADRDRLALQLFYGSAHSYKQVASALDVPPERVGTLLARARARLGKLLGLDG